jgi:ribosomal protein S18 acetylase RimI-like enzyme
MIKNPTLSIRRATIEDASLLAEIGARTFFDTFAKDNTAEDMAMYLASSFSTFLQAEELTNPLITFLVAEIEGVTVGYAKLIAASGPEGVTERKAIELSRIYVTQDWIGKGVGEAILKACVEEAKQGGNESLWLAVWERNERAQRFYEKRGFRIVGERKFELGRDIQTDWVMELELTSQ